jgi:hypothetical protein
VEGDQTFAALIGRESGQRVLDTGIASYGSVRELMMLGRVDRTRTKTILWQFCNNDYVENEAYVKNGNRLPTLSRAEWEGWVAAHARERRYVPFRYLIRAVGSRLEALFGTRGPDPANPDPDDPAVRKKQVDDFLDVLETSPVDLTPYRIVLFEMNGRNQNADWFLRMLAEELRTGTHSDVAKRLVLVDVAARLAPEDYYLLDDHLTPAGHRKVAGILLPYVEDAAPRRAP